MDGPEVANVAHTYIDNCSRVSMIRSARRDQEEGYRSSEGEISRRGDGLASEREGLQLPTVAINCKILS